MSFVLSNEVDPSKVFLTRKSQLTGRWDPSYFRPDLVALEKQVRDVTARRLRDFVERMAGGATPSTKEAETHYTEGEEGIPFIRVQNLSTTGKLNLEDCKLITRSTHEGLLARSRLSGGELLVKITGVGRMAVASVVPDGFEGNINQHIVAIRTKDTKTSETLAAYLNLDLAERLASRRSTGGTRPALDYPALLSIPIVFDERIPALIGAAVENFNEKVRQASTLLVGIDDVLLAELGITLQPEPPNTIENRMFYRRFSEVSGERLNANFYRSNYRLRHTELDNCSHLVLPLGKLKGQVFQGVGRKLVESARIQLLKVKNITRSGDIDFEDTEPVDEVPKNKILRVGDIISPFIGAAIKQYKFAMFLGAEQDYTVDNNTGVIRISDERISQDYLVIYCRSYFVRWQLDQLTGGGGVPYLGAEYAKKIRVVVPSHNIQKRIIEKVHLIRKEAENLNARAIADLEKAKNNIEALILGEGGQS